MDIHQIRRNNLRVLIEEYGGVTNLSRKIGKDQGFVSQLSSKKHSRNIGSKVARDVETALKLPRGWMDVIHTGEPGEPSIEALKSVIEAAEKALAAEKIHLSIDKKAELIVALYPLASGGDPVNPDMVRGLLRAFR